MTLHHILCMLNMLGKYIPCVYVWKGNCHILYCLLVWKIIHVLHDFSCLFGEYDTWKSLNTKVFLVEKVVSNIYMKLEQRKGVNRYDITGYLQVEILNWSHSGLKRISGL